MPIQVPFPFRFHANQDFDTYHAGPNRFTLDSLKAAAENRGEQFLFVCGPSGVGKSHLLQATCQSADSNNFSTAYLPLRNNPDFSHEILQGLEALNLVCIDDIDAISGIPTWETALFHLFNRLEAASGKLVISSARPPRDLGIHLADLFSRLQSGLLLHVGELDDSDKLAALILKAKNLGFTLPENVGRFILHRYPRDLTTLWEILARLDYASLSEQRKLTIPFLKAQLSDGLETTRSIPASPKEPDQTVQ